MGAQSRMPPLFYAEGSGGRPVNTDRLCIDEWLVQFAKLSGLVLPVVCVVSCCCFGRNAAMLACCPVIIPTKNTSIGLGRPAIMEGGDLGVFQPAELGPVSFQSPNGVIDLVVEDEKKATRTAPIYLSCFQSPAADSKMADLRPPPRCSIPEDSLRVCDIRPAIDLIADQEFVFELRRAFGSSMITASIGIEGKPFGLRANNSRHLGEAIDSAAGDKAARPSRSFTTHSVGRSCRCAKRPASWSARDKIRRRGRGVLNVRAGSEPDRAAVRHRAALRFGRTVNDRVWLSQLFHRCLATDDFGGIGLERYVRLGVRNEIKLISLRRRRVLLDARWRGCLGTARAASIVSVFEIDNVIDREDETVDQGGSTLCPNALSSNQPQTPVYRCC